MANRVTQENIEAADAAPTTSARVTQINTETAAYGAALARITALNMEAGAAPSTTLARVTMLNLEYAVGLAIIIPAPQNPAAEGDCEGTILVTTDSVPLAITYLLERSPDGITWAQIASVTP